MLRTHSTCHIYTVIHLYTEITFKLCNDLCILFIIYNNYAMQNVAYRLFTCVERFRNFQPRLCFFSSRWPRSKINTTYEKYNEYNFTKKKSAPIRLFCIEVLDCSFTCSIGRIKTSISKRPARSNLNITRIGGGREEGEGCNRSLAER